MFRMLCLLRPPGLNRTSVGLKLKIGELPVDAERRLNRTSVGLKPWTPSFTSTVTPTPQSNQRGIETAGRRAMGRTCKHASIEPAWD